MTTSSIEAFVSTFQGSVIQPGDPEYDSARQTWNLAFQARPALIVYPDNKEAVASAVKFALQENLPIAVQSTGHGVILPADDSLLIKTSRMNNVRINAEQQTAWIEAGVQWGEVLAASQPFGLAPLLGSSPNVGVVGYTLGGGMGWLARKYGLAADSVLSFELVTPDGVQRQASARENTDLFWALRGGGGNFGVVTGMEIRLYPVTQVYAGNLLYPIDQAKAVFTRYREWIHSAPDELTSSIVIMNYPPIPQIPEFLRGKSYAIVRGCYCGSMEAGENLLKFWRDWQAPEVDGFKVMPFSEAAAISNDPHDPMPSYSSGMWLRELSDEVLDTVIENCVARPGALPLVVTELRHAGGALNRTDDGVGAYGNRSAAHSLQFIALSPSPEVNAALAGFISGIKAKLQPYQTGGVYLNFLEGEEARQRTPDGFGPANFQRLQAAKAAYDPDNRMRHSFDIPPAA